MNENIKIRPVFRVMSFMVFTLALIVEFYLIYSLITESAEFAISKEDTIIGYFCIALVFPMMIYLFYYFSFKGEISPLLEKFENKRN